MTRVDIVTVAIRLAAIWLIVQTSALVTMAVATYAGLRGVPPSIAVQIGLLLVFTILSWAFSPTLARYVLPAPDTGERAAPFSRRDAERIVFRVIGVLLTVSAIGSLFSMFVIWIVRNDITGGAGTDPVARMQGAAALAEHGFKLLVGICLFVGVEGFKGIARFGRRRDVGGGVGAAAPAGSPED